MSDDEPPGSAQSDEEPDIVIHGGTWRGVDNPKGFLRTRGGSQVEIREATVTGFERAFQVGPESELTIDGSSIIDNYIGIQAAANSRVNISESYLNNIVADIVHHEDAEVSQLRSIAKEVVRITDSSLSQPDADLNREAREVLKAEDEEEVRERFEHMSKTAIGYLIKYGGLAAGVDAVHRSLLFLARNLPDVADSVSP